MTPSAAATPRTRWAAIGLTLCVAALTTAVAWLGMRGEPPTPALAPAGASIEDAQVRTIVLPHDEPDFPQGPHRETFLVSCTTCHSSRLIATQPPFSRKQWADSVHKMVAVYGAPITLDSEADIVDYLTTIRSE